MRIHLKLIFMSLLLCFSCDKEEQPEEVIPPTFTSTTLPDLNQTILANTEDGTVSSLDWADAVFISCIDDEVLPQFEGRQLFYEAYLPSQSTLDIVVTPNLPNQEISVFAYANEVGNVQYPPDTLAFLNCSADPVNGGSEFTGMKQVSLSTFADSVTVLIGVCSPMGESQGLFNLGLFYNE